VIVKGSSEIVIHDGGVGCDPCHAQQQQLPVEMGGSTSTEWGCFAGTLGFVACDPVTQKRGYVSNNHIATASGFNLCENGPPGLMGLHTASLDANPVCFGNTTQIGTLEKVVTLLNFPTSNLADAAFVASSDTQTSPMILDIGMPTNTPGSPTLGSCVCKSGRTSGMTCGRIDLVNATLNVSGYCLGILRFQQIVGYTADASCPGGSCTHPPCPMSEPGDSGSPVLDSNNNIVALNFAGDNDGNGFGADINNVLNELGVTLDLSQCGNGGGVNVIVIEDAQNPLKCVTFNRDDNTYTWKEADGNILTGNVNIFERGDRTIFRSLPGDPNGSLRAFVRISRQIGRARLTSGGDQTTIRDGNVNDNSPCP